MKLVMGHVNGVTLDAVHQELVKGCSDIRAAVAYASDRLPLFDPAHCSVPVEFFGRLDGVDPDLLDEILRQGDRITCHLVPRSRNLHAKIIWWRGRGAYVGSANLTDAAWLRNLECGVFYDGDELAGGVGEELLRFFDHLKGGDFVSPTPKLVTELRALHAERASAAEQASRTLAGVESAAAVLPSATTVVDLFGETLHVPPRGPQDLPIARVLLRKTDEQGKQMWHAPCAAWAYCVIDMYGPKTRQVDLARDGGRSAPGATGEYLRIMAALLPKHRDIIVHWLRTAEECRRRPRGSKASYWPVSKGEMLEVMKSPEPQWRSEYERRAKSKKRSRSAVGRPLGA